MRWHLDAWDREAGRAFATQRPVNEDLSAHLENWGPTIYIGPPGFRPEQVANFALALSARRQGSYLPRVPLDEARDELGFRSAEAAADFVRRAFIATGRGRDDGGAAPRAEGGPRTPPEGELPPEQPIEAQPTNIRSFLNLFIATCEGVDESDGGKPMLMTLDEFGTPAGNRSFESVESGALQLAIHLLAGFPGVPQRPEDESWFAAAAELHRVFGELGLWAAWLRRGVHVPLAKYWSLENVIDGILKQFGVKGAAPNIHYVAMMKRLFMTRPVAAHGQSASDATQRFLYTTMLTVDGPIVMMFPGDGSMSSDRFELLFRLPVPHYVRAEGFSTLGQLLAAFVGSPKRFQYAPASALGLVAFAAAFLTSRAEEQRSPGWRDRAAGRWLARSMPAWVFSPAAEEIIERAEKEEDTAAAAARDQNQFREHGA